MNIFQLTFFQPDITGPPKTSSPSIDNALIRPFYPDCDLNLDPHAEPLNRWVQSFC